MSLKERSGAYRLGSFDVIMHDSFQNPLLTVVQRYVRI
jgi:hypothetical protein